MNSKQLLLVLQKDYTTIEVVFRGSAQRYVYKAKLKEDIKKGDQVIVDSPKTGLTIVEVVNVHAVPKVDLDTSFTYKWVVQKVDRTEYDKTLAKEEEFLIVMDRLEQISRRESELDKFRQSLSKNNEVLKVFELAIAKVTDDNS